MEVFTILHCYKGLYGCFYYFYTVVRVCMKVFLLFLHCYKGLYGGFYYPYTVIRFCIEVNNVNNHSLFRPHNDVTTWICLMFKKIPPFKKNQENQKRKENQNRTKILKILKISQTRFFPKNQSIHIFTSCTVSEKTNDSILRKKSIFFWIFFEIDWKKLEKYNGWRSSTPIFFGAHE